MDIWNGTTLLNLIKKPAAKARKSPSAPPVHEQVYQKLRAQILFGEMAPGQAVTIQGLTDSLGAGMTPVREAIRRLISDGALMFQGNRRVSVPVLSATDVEQLTFIRKKIEAELARRAAQHASPALVEELERIDAEVDSAISIGDVSGYLMQNYRFHSVLYDYADAPILSEMAERLWLRFGPSLRVVCGRFGTQNLPDRHKEMLTALRRRDAEGVSRAIEQDVDQGVQMVTAVLAERRSDS
ncbi:GntR family transcriptional regulator [Pseudodonghicola flavimaris]|uniref:GntR family transcriptional regulator n=1 Tax=Pseudodonghicola flavimaris TaxID=3050036 RepID=A0ABT7EX49_9RHOB|nr:GntR family transcriptional regulator [Pseudodonghicola flavimaris]MDK3016908.1 GntR family transcriptional regulator [Pseudodonghicola flavimaris]